MCLVVFSKIKIMGKAKKERPSGPDQDERTGVPNNMPADQNVDDQNTEKYTDDRDNVNDNIRVLHPNRNVDKDIETGPPYS